MPYLSVFGQQFWKTIVIFEISALQFALLQSLMQKNKNPLISFIRKVRVKIIQLKWRTSLAEQVNEQPQLRSIKSYSLIIHTGTNDLTNEVNLLTKGKEELSSKRRVTEHQNHILVLNVTNICIYRKKVIKTNTRLKNCTYQQNIDYSRNLYIKGRPTPCFIKRTQTGNGPSEKPDPGPLEKAHPMPKITVWVKDSFLRYSKVLISDMTIAFSNSGPKVLK